MKTAERELARALRREEGLSIKTIAKRVGVSVSSVSLWVRDIELTEAQHAALLGANGAYERQRKGRAVASANRRRERLLAQQSGRTLARLGEPLHVAGCMLYWAEGSKRRNDIRLSNSDPELVRFFVTFLRAYFPLEDTDFRITCHLFADHIQRQREIEEFWLDTLGLPQTCLRKSIVNVYSKYSQKKRTNKLPYGTCRVVVGKTCVIQSIYGAIQEYAGISREAWLD
jgi:transcriptional regulator with XRE-family HTH domain